jgi:hypothetical protein
MGLALPSPFALAADNDFALKNITKKRHGARRSDQFLQQGGFT